MTLGAFLREQRKARGLSVPNIAAQLNLSAGYWRLLESDRSASPGEEKLREIAAVLNVDADQLLVLAGKLPSDVKAGLLRHPVLIAAVRAAIII